MNQVIKEFRELCGILIDKHGYNTNKIVVESKISYPTIKTVLSHKWEDHKWRSDIQEPMKRFVEKHSDKLRSGYQPGIKEPTPHPGPEPNKESEFWQLFERARKIKPVNVTLQILIK